MATAADNLSLSERLTSHFYGWERRGRGWQMFDVPVRIEPPFRPFPGHYVLDPPSPHDDGRKPTFLSQLVKEVGRAFTGRNVKGENNVTVPPRHEVVEEDTEREWVELSLVLPKDATPDIKDFEQLLVSHCGCRGPVCFELVGTATGISVGLVVDEADEAQVTSQIEAYFPEVVLGRRSKRLREVRDEVGADASLVVDFGLSREWMLSLATHRTLHSDLYVSLMAALSRIQAGEMAVFQVMLQPVRHAWAESVVRAVTFPDGGPFFEDAPEFTKAAREKTRKPLFAAVVRVAVGSADVERTWEIARGMAGAFSQLADIQGNELIPLANDDYADADHLRDFLNRQSRRSGMLLNCEELATLVHLPTESVQSSKLERLKGKTKAAPASAIGHSLILGTNAHGGRSTTVSLSLDQRVRHMHVVGASGTGKSTFLLNLILQDICSGQGIGVLDPHGDLIDAIIERIPESRIKDVILVDPSDDQYPIGFNILSAHSDLEKTLLASDFVGIFRRFSTSWGDQMGSVLSNAVLAFLESTTGGTLCDLRRFLIEPAFRTTFLTTVTDDHVRYYWQQEFKHLSGRPQAPLLTRLDTFLRPKPIRYMVSQQTNRLDFADMLDSGKIFLAKLAQGAIGEENATLLGSLFVSKFHQLTLGRQSQSESSRRPFFLYADEFHNFVTPSMAKLLSGARKFRLGLILAHQDLQQLHDPDVESALLANAGTRICFRLGDKDAKTLSEGFASFTTDDFRNLRTGEALCRIGRSEDDCNIATTMLQEVAGEEGERRREQIIKHTRQIYATKREVIDAQARDRGEGVPEQIATKEQAPEQVVEQGTNTTSPAPAIGNAEEVEAAKVEQVSPPVQVTKPRKPKAMPPVVAAMGKGGMRHKYLQHMVAQCGQQRGWRATIEMQVKEGSVDVVLERENRRIAVEISVTSTVELEMGNLRKCLAAGFADVVMLCDEGKTLRGLQKVVEKELSPDVRKGVRILSPEEFVADEGLLAEAMTQEQVVRGYKVKVRREQPSAADGDAKRRVIGEVLARAMRKGA